MVTTSKAEINIPWRSYAEPLASWAWDRLVNRHDCWGAYWPLHRREQGNSWTAPRRADRGKVFLTPDVLQRHFAATDPEHVIGLHTTSPDNVSLWGAVEVDWHGEDSNAPGKNLAAALRWYGRLRSLGFNPLLTDSNGKGGYHVRVLFAERVSTPRVYAFLRWLIRDYRDFGFSTAPETFPKQATVCERAPYGNWLRVPGRHHTREHWSRVWNGRGWLDGVEAIAFILALAGDSPSLIPAAAITPPPVPKPPLRRLLTTGDLSARIRGRIKKLPNLREGEGRDRVAYSFAAWLVRDLQLPDQDALPWLQTWDDGNHPPKGEVRLRELLENVRRYGRHDYGAGLTGAQRVRFTVGAEG